MIVPLKKVTVVCVDNSRDATLETLRELGVLHLIPLQTRGTDSLSLARKNMGHVQKAIEALPHVKDAKDTDGISADDVHAVLTVRKKNEEKLSFVKNELNRLAAFGGFDPAAIRELAAKGVFIKLYECEESVYQIPSGDCSAVEFRRKNGTIFYALVSRTEMTGTGHEVRLPESSVAALKAEQQQIEKTLQECTDKLNAYGHHRASLQKTLSQATDHYEKAQAEAGMLAGNGVSLIQGYCPDDSLQRLRETAPQMGWGLRVEEPREEENVPTLLRHPKLVKPIETLYKVIGITPGYREIDISAVFLLFFTIFFALIVGDAGYGLLFVAALVWGRHKFPAAPKEIFQFLGLMSGVTIFWGVLNASYFGISTEFLPAFLDLVRAGYTPEPLRNAMVWIRDSENLKFFCFIIGLTHLTIAHLWNAWVNRRSSIVLAQVGWLCTTWTMFFLAGTMVLNKPFPEFARYLVIIGVILIFFFSVPPSKLREGWFNLVMLPFNLVNNFVDIISYIRLFAVGMAGFSLANSFNTMVAPMFGSVSGIFIGALILFVAHAMNIFLAVMGVAVHAVRLNTLEFSNNAGLEWSGTLFTPFSKQKN